MHHEIRYVSCSGAPSFLLKQSLLPQSTVSGESTLECVVCFLILGFGLQVVLFVEYVVLYLKRCILIVFCM